MAGEGKPGPAPGQRFGGRRAGTPNKLSRDVKEMILTALEGAGGAAYLQRQATENPGAFLTLVGKVLPLQLTGSGDGPVQVHVVKYSGVAAVSYDATTRQAIAPVVIEADEPVVLSLRADYDTPERIDAAGTPSSSRDSDLHQEPQRQPLAATSGKPELSQLFSGSR